MKKILSLLVIAVAASAVTIGAYEYLELGKKEVIIEKTQPESPFRYVDNTTPYSGAVADFTGAAEISTPAVVHIISTKISSYNTYDPWRELFGDDFFGGAPKNPQERRQQSSGSGVIISNDGYIVTNNHVVSAADEVEITLFNKESYMATVIGTDPTTDLALLKIEADDLPHLSFANSDDVRIGEWVLAVGNPFNLESTVTAGIVSAKGRNINILRDQYSIESFIQTDAAVNPGNSGGALVDLNGDLIGINTAIATPTGVYAGYSFAVPANIVNKVCEDLKNYGMVQRGFLGVMIRGVDSKLADEFDLDVNAGVYIDDLVEDGAAAEAGIEKGDVIVEIDGKTITGVPELQESVGSKRPGDEVKVKVNRDGKEKALTVLLKNKDGEAKITEKEEISPLLALGIDLKDIDIEELKKLGVNNGVKVEKVNDGLLRRNTKIRPGFIITKIDDKAMKSAKDVEVYFENKKTGKGMIEGFYPGIPGKVYYGYGLD
jgi:Do/DeqQ family serine protease